ncbi:MAG: 4Fe-4S binding protein [Actinomycetota bacterium]
MRKNLIKRNWRTFMAAALIWQPVTDLWAKTTAWPVIGRLTGWIVNRDHYDVTFIPINEGLAADGSTVLPKQVVEEMIRRSCHRVILPICLCRMGCRCQDYPMEIGCIFLGEGARQIDPSIGRAVSVEEALEHLERSIAAGLVPQIGRVDPDPLWLGVRMKDWDHFLTLCFCCTCCCIAMRNQLSWYQDMRDRMHRLEGLSIEISDDCDGCGKCAKRCFAQAITIEDRKARIGEACKGCGLCVEVCPRDAISISVIDGERMLSEAFRRIESYADIT